MEEIEQKAIEMLELLLNEYDSHSIDYEICSDFIEYLKDKNGKNIRAIGIKSSDGNQINCDFGYPHRYSPAYLKCRYAKLYLLDAWYQEHKELPLTFLSFTIRHNFKPYYENDNSKTLWFYDGFRKLYEGKQLLFRELRRMRNKSQLEYLMIVEPHGDGYPHYHMILFTSFTFVEKQKLCRKWEKWQMGSVENGLNFDERLDSSFRSIRNYLMKYMSKSFIDYSSKYQGCFWTKEQLLFNAVAWKYQFRTWCASRTLSGVMRIKHESREDDVVWQKITMGYDIGKEYVEHNTLWVNETIMNEYLEKRNIIQKGVIEHGKRRNNNADTQNR